MDIKREKRNHERPVRGGWRVAAVMVPLIFLLAVIQVFLFPPAGTAVEPAREPAGIVETATPTIAGTDRAVSREDIVPSDVKTREDFNLPFDTGEETPRASIWRVIGSLAIIALLIVGAVYLMRLMLARGMRYDLRGRHIKIMDVVQLGLNRSLYLVSVENKVLLLGSTDKGLTYLADISVKEETGAGGGTGGVEFGDALRDAAVEQTAAGGDQDNLLDKLRDRLKRLEDDGQNE